MEILELDCTCGGHEPYFILDAGICILDGYLQYARHRSDHIDSKSHKIMQSGYKHLKNLHFAGLVTMSAYHF